MCKFIKTSIWVSVASFFSPTKKVHTYFLGHYCYQKNLEINSASILNFTETCKIISLFLMIDKRDKKEDKTDEKLDSGQT